MLDTTVTLSYEDGMFGVNDRKFKDDPIGRNKFMSAVMERVMTFERIVEESKDHRTDYHQDRVAGVAPATNREDYFRAEIQRRIEETPEYQHIVRINKLVTEVQDALRAGFV